VSKATAESAGVSARFLADVLKRPVTLVEEAHIGADRGFAGTVLRLSLTPSGHHPATVIAKLGSPTDTAVRREAAFYRDIGPELSAPTAQCWYAGSTPDGSQAVLLDDLTHSRPGDVLTGASPRNVSAVLREMASVWRHGDKPPAGRLPRYSTAGRHDWQNRYAAQWDGLAATLRGQLPDEVWSMGEQLRTRLAAISARLLTGSPTVLHGDLHLDNVLFTTSGKPIVIDWATARIGPLALDLFPFLATSLSPQDHNRHAADLIDDLLETVQQRHTEDFDDQGRCALLRHFAGIIGWISHPPTDNPREAALRHAALHDGRLVNALLQWNAQLALTYSASEPDR
jgi:hypothetical protein